MLVHYGFRGLQFFLKVFTCYIFGQTAKNAFYPQMTANTTCPKALIFWPINMKFGRQVHWGGVVVHVYSQLPTPCIFGRIAKNAFLQFFLTISRTNFPIDVNFGIQVHCVGVHVHVNFQVHTCYIFANIAKKAFSFFFFSLLLLTMVLLYI